MEGALDGMNARKNCEQNQYLYITALEQTRRLPTVHVNDPILQLKPMEMLGVHKKKPDNYVLFLKYNMQFH